MNLLAMYLQKLFSTILLLLTSKQSKNRRKVFFPPLLLIFEKYKPFLGKNKRTGKS